MTPVETAPNGCEALVGQFAWFSQMCMKSTVAYVPCLDDHCNEKPHRHAVCVEHSGLVAP